MAQKFNSEEVDMSNCTCIKSAWNRLTGYL